MSFEEAGEGPGSSPFTLRDPRVMRALAHPRRVELLRQLRSGGPATATVLGEATRQSPASASYHLRQLAAHGLVEEIPGRGAGRERWWRARHAGTHLDVDAFLAPETRTEAVALAGAVLGDSTRIALRFLDAAERGDVEQTWLDAARIDDTTIHATPDELLDLGRRIADLVAPYVRNDPAQRPAGARACHVAIQAIPLRP